MIHGSCSDLNLNMPSIKKKKLPSNQGNVNISWIVDDIKEI